VSAVKSRRDLLFWALFALTAAVFAFEIGFVFLKVPEAQAGSGGIAQKIFYFHVPAAYAMYLSGGVGFLASALYLYGATDARDAWAKAGAECAVCFGSLVLTSGPLWAKKAWGVYWTFDPRLTTLLLTVLIYAAVVMLRAFGGAGEAERRFAAALTVLGTVTLPIVHYSVQKWGGNHPTVITKGGGGLGHPDMKLALGIGFFAMTLLAALLLWMRARLNFATSRLAAAEEAAAAAGIGETT
jgi:heme exporter protein C